MSLPEYMTQGETARLFPVLSTSSREGRATSIFLSCLSLIDGFSHEIMQLLGRRLGSRARVTCFTEVVLKGVKDSERNRPDGLIEISSGRSVWRCLLETKVGNNKLDADQIERYRAMAQEAKIDAVLTISNELASRPDLHPIQSVQKSRSKTPVLHLSWMRIMTHANLLLDNDEIDNPEKTKILSEFVRFLEHESTGVKGFDRMPSEWADLAKLVSAGGQIPVKSDVAAMCIDAWHQEVRDISLLLSRETGSKVRELMPRRWVKEPELRNKNDLKTLREKHYLSSNISIPGTASPLTVTANVSRRTIEAYMELGAPEDKKSNSARLNWLLRQIKSEEDEDTFIRCLWPGSSEKTTFSLSELREEPSKIDQNKSHLQVRGFEVVLSRNVGARFSQLQNFVVDIEQLVLHFYSNVGQDLKEWRKPAPKIDRAIRNQSEDINDQIFDGSESDEFFGS